MTETAAVVVGNSVISFARVMENGSENTKEVENEAGEERQEHEVVARTHVREAFAQAYKEVKKMNKEVGMQTPVHGLMSSVMKSAVRDRLFRSLSLPSSRPQEWVQWPAAVALTLDDDWRYKSRFVQPSCF